MIRDLFGLRQGKSALAEAGTVAAEFAVCLPILVIVITSLIDYANAVNLSTKLFSAARAGAQYAVYHPGDTAGIAATVELATSDPACTARITTNCMTVSGPSFAYYCVNVSTGVIGTSAQSSTAACGAGFILGHFVTLTASQNYSPPLLYSGLGGALTLTGSAVLQVE